MANERKVKMKCFVSDHRDTAMEKLSEWTECYGCFGGRDKEIVDVKIVTNKDGVPESVIVLYHDD